METIPLAALIEEAIADHRFKQLSGQVTSFDQLMAEDSLITLEQEYSVVFAFLAFHPAADAVVADYVKEGTLGSDSGTKILVLFTLETATRAAGPAPNVPGVLIDSGIHPAYEMVRTLFAPKPPPPLPGIIFVSTFSGDPQAVYAHLDGIADPAAMRARLRQVFALAEKAFGPEENREKFAGSFAAALQQAQLPHSQSGRTSMREWLIRTAQFAAKYRSDLVAIIGALP